MKSRIRIVLLVVLVALLAAPVLASGLPEGFVYITDVIPTAKLDIRYYTGYNFVGTRIEGYHAPTAILTKEAAEALKQAAEILDEQGYYIKVFDAYRPLRAVEHFVLWAQDLDDQKMKADFYPEVDKERLFELGYVALRSGHSRGSVVDLTLIYKDTLDEVDMGSPFDFFGEISHHGTDLITPEQEANRNILRDAMVAAGFEPYPEEWWHYRLADEPYTDRYFDFPVDSPDFQSWRGVLDEAMEKSVERARQTMNENIGGPFGAAIFDMEGNIIVVASNSVLRDHDPTAHAEVNAIREAGRVLGTHDLSGYILYATGYPCPMCLAATIWSNISHVIYGARPEDAEAIGFRDDFIYRFIEGGRVDSSILLIEEYGRDACVELFQEYAEMQKQIY
jgi:D-alanyl-D-alanine dipeptidase/tRNA(Arg) A34 adenosine deaminase TadA